MKKINLLLALVVFATASCAMATAYAANGEIVLYRLPPVEQVLSQDQMIFRGQLADVPVQDVSFLGAGIGSDKGSGKGDCGCDDGKSCGGCRQGYLDSVQLILGFDAWAARLDDDDWNNFGARMGFNVARRIGDSNAFWQAGMAYGIYDWDGHEQGDTTDNEEQVFVTLGAFRKADPCCGRSVTIGGVIDYLHDENVGEEHNQSIDLYQARYRVGYATSVSNEFGIVGALRVGDNENFTTANAGTFQVRPLDYASAYWEHTFDNNSRLMASFGWLSEPGELMFGVNGEVPFNDYFSMYGNFMYGKPSTSAGDFAPNGFEQSYSEAYWNVQFGLIYYFRGCVGAESSPLMPVGDNGNFLVGAPVGAL